MCSKEDEPNNCHDVTFLNRTNDKIYVGCVLNSWAYIVPSDILMKNGLAGLSPLGPGESFSMLVDFEDIINGANLDSSLCQFLVFKESTIENNSVQDIMKNYIYDKRLVYTFAELKRNGYRIVYTGE